MPVPTSTAELIESLEQYDDVLSWINDTLQASDESDDAISPPAVDLSELDHDITNLLATLDIASEDTSSQLERIIDDVSRGIPRLAYDLHFMKDGASTLQATLSGVVQRSRDAVPSATSIALDKLHYLDTIKGHMEASREVLREAESWSTLELEVTSLIAERSYAKAAERLSEASRSMVVFQNTPEYDPRRTLMINLQNQLEASLSSALVSAINAQDSSACRDYFSIFSIIQRESEFRNYYNASRRAPITALWQNVWLADCGSTASTSPEGPLQSFADFLPKFYSSFLTLLNAERTSICSIFPDPSNTLSQFISATLSSLQPTFPQRLSALVSHHGDRSLSELISALRATEEFAVNVKKVVEKVEYATLPPTQRPASSSEKPSHVRRRSSRMSISLRSRQYRPSVSLGNSKTGQEPPEIVEAMEWDQELFQPFIDFQTDYSSLERRFLEQSLNEIISNDSRERIQDVDRPRLLRERAVDIFGVAEGSLTRCNSFTHGYGAASLVQALDGFFESFIDMWTADTQIRNPSSPSSSQNSASGGDLADLDYTSQDWSDIQLSLHLLASARAIFERLTTFEVRLQSFLGQVETQFRISQSDPINFLAAPSRGETQLLEQSPLNSAELHNLLSSLDNQLPTPALTPGFRKESNSGPDPLLLHSRKSLFGFSQTCQTALQKTILSPLWNHLSSYATSPIWNTTTDSESRRRAGDLYVPTFSLSPTDTVQRIAEGLLNLPRLFEVYADDDALAFSLQTLPYVEPNMLKGLSGESTEMATQQGHRRRSSVTATKPAAIDPELVSSAWLLSLGHSFLEHLVQDVLPAITRLSTSGAEQLASDLEYLSNIVQALNVEHEALDKWRVLVSVDDKEGEKMLLENDSPDAVLVQVSRLRGWQK